MSIKTKIWNKDFILLWVCNFFLFSTFYALIATVPLFVMDGLAGNKQQSGIAMMVFLIAAVLARVVSGRLLDSLGRKKIFYLAVLLFMLSSFAYLFVITFNTVQRWGKRQWLFKKAFYM